MVDTLHGVFGEHVTNHVILVCGSEHVLAPTRYLPTEEQIVSDQANRLSYAMLIRVLSKSD